MGSSLHLFEGFGLELEYMIVNRDTLDVRPVADRLLSDAGGGYEQEVEHGDVAWSNELALHVIEMKSNGPTAALAGWGARFQSHVGRINEALEPLNARLMPSAMHPWMDPDRELRLWPHDNDVIYRTFDRIFDCRGHGWANLQSMHINLPFSGDEEFGRLHAAIRCVLPILPALAAASPFVDGVAAPARDMRMQVYATNARAVPAVSGAIVPEGVYSRRAYEEDLLESIYADLAPHDPDGVLRHEWVNARGAIARFDRGAIEIRVIDLQEHPAADIAVAGAVVAVVRALVEERWESGAVQRGWSERDLSRLLRACVVDAEDALIADVAYLELFGWRRGPCRAGDLWAWLIEQVVADAGEFSEWRDALTRIVEQGTLASRLRRAAGVAPVRATLREVYGRLCDSLAAGVGFDVPRARV